MNIIGVDDKKAIVVSLEKILKKIDPDGDHRFYTDPIDAVNDLDKPIDAAFLDAEMPKMNGIELAKRIIQRYPRCSIIFLAGNTEYMRRAFEIHSSGYLLKPITDEAVRDALAHRRYRVADMTKKPVKVQCFGSFEVFYNDRPVPFSRKKTKELFAFLIDRKGEKCGVDTIISGMEPTSEINRSTRSQTRVFLSDLTRTFDNLGIYDIVIRKNYSAGINASLVDCDYYRLLDGDPFALFEYTGEYMTQYEFAAETRAYLLEKYLKQNFDKPTR